MITDAPNLNILWAELIIEELIRNGVDHFIISPGSRSTPLTIAAARNPKAKNTVHFDERGAAFFALGFSRHQWNKAALICTSGTAVANYLPALVEAFQSNIPLLAITADRPPELQQTGSNQTIDQVQIFGHYARYCALPCPDPLISPEFVLTTIDEAVDAAERFAGPVHLNCMFREPLAPDKSGIEFTEYIQSVGTWLQSNDPYTNYEPAAMNASDSAIEVVRECLSKAMRPLIVLGQLPPGKDATTCELRCCRNDLAEITLPVFPDITSGLRFQDFPQTVITHYDLMLLSETYRNACNPDVVLHLGGRLVSKRLQEHLARIRPRHYIHVGAHSSRQDPSHLVTRRIVANPAQFFRSVCQSLKTTSADRWLQTHTDALENTLLSLNTSLAVDERLTEPGLSVLLSSLLDKDAALFLGNSMPIRDMSMFGVQNGNCYEVIANRGASGIDGNIATASGYALASSKHVIAAIGDVATLHDLNSLSLLRAEGVRVTLVIVNNNGGGIFHFLPIAEHTDVFEKYFGTPHGLHFEDAARMFGLPYSRPATKAEFIEDYKKAQDSAASCIIEVVTNREENLRLHRKISDAVVEALEQL